MAFDSLSERLQSTLKKVSGQGQLTESNMEEMLTEIRLALLEADVNYQVVKEFIASTKEKAIGADVVGSLKPGQVLVKIVHDELVHLLGDEVSEVDFSKKPTVIMMVGLQGSGKTTTSGKIAKLIKTKYAKKPLLVAGDIYRPAAVDQLVTLGKQLDVPVYEKGTSESAENIVKGAMNYAALNNNDVIIIDTAGRLHIDEPLMQELANVKEIAKPDEILLVVDSLTGQDIVNVAASYNEKLSITGAVLTKLDGDTRGGAALSIRAVTQKPIKFIGMGEKLDDLEPFHPDRMASRILGMGDVLSLIEKAQETMDMEKAKAQGAKLKKQEFDFEDFLDQMEQIQKMGSMDKILGMIPGMGDIKNQLGDVDMNGKVMNRIKAIIQSMTVEERRNPQILNASRIRRIAKGSGTSVQEVNKLIKQFNEMKVLNDGDSFGIIGSTICDNFNVKYNGIGSSILELLQ